MNALEKAFCLALAATSVLARGPPPPTSSLDAYAQGSSSFTVAAKPLEGPVKVLNYVAADVGGDELEADNVDELHANAGGRNFEDVDVVAQVKFGGLRATASNSCLGPGSGGNPLRPRPVRNGERYRFNIKVDAECRDADNLTYEWGEFQNVMDTTECAEKCVTLPDASLVDGGTFRGIEFACSTKQCRCMYDAGTLSTRSSRGFNRSRTNQAGEGSITKYAPKTDRYCGKLVGATTLEIVVQ